MSRQQLITAASLVGGVVVLALMAIIGLNAATSPIASSEKPASSGCSAKEISRQIYLQRKEITVSVYNAGAKAGFARTTLERFESLGFNAGAIGNAPTGEKVAKAVVYTSASDTAAAELVAQTLGGNVPVKTSTEDMGPGVDVLIGVGQKKLNGKAPKRIKLHTPIETCVKVS